MAMRDAGCAASLLCLLFLCLTVSFQQYEACRTLRGRREGAVTGKSEEAGAGHSFGLHFHSLSRGTVPPSGPSGCTYIPGSGGSKCLALTADRRRQFRKETGHCS
ncbi:hypothetical protein SAY87_023634 [Trapa incisa]|uniref:Secreted protein n=1 Tax=Trapa incisa TaxID=236973 RepID=A0AAN7L3T3_9MYRT|nr:hypothetical protein SAY87_023634 [Trapa incisa]